MVKTARRAEGGGEGRAGRREPRPKGARNRRLLEGAAAAAGLEKVATSADGNCKYPPGGCGEGCWGPCDRAAARVGASVRVSVSVSGCERSAGLTVTLAGPAVPGSLLRVPLLQRLPPCPARFLLAAPTARRLHSGSSAAPSPSPLSPSLSVAPSPPQRRCPLGLLRRAPGRAVWEAPQPAVATAAAARGWWRPGAFPLAAGTAQVAASSPYLGFRNLEHTPKRYFFKSGYNEWALEM